MSGFKVGDKVQVLTSRAEMVEDYSYYGEKDKDDIGVVTSVHPKDGDVRLDGEVGGRWIRAVDVELVEDRERSRAMNHIESYDNDKVQHPTITSGNKFGVNGLSFQFRSSTFLTVDSMVKVGDIPFEVIQIGLLDDQDYHYKVEVTGYSSRNIHKSDDFSLMVFNNKPVIVITDEDETKGIRRSNSFC